MKKYDKICYLCQQGQPIIYFRKLGHSIYRCPQCHLLTLDFREDYNTFLLRYYQKGYFTGDKENRAYADYAEDKPNIAKNARNILKKIKKIKPQGALLDVGCAMGFFMEEAQRIGYKVYGIEVSSYAAKAAQQKFAKNIFLGSVEEFIQKKTDLPVFSNLLFDVIVLSDLIEHLKDPREVLKGLRKILKKDGIIVIETGDAGSLWARLMGKNWHFFAPPQHLYFFSRETLSKILAQAEYKVIKITKEGKYLSARYILHMTQYINLSKIGDILSRFILKTPIGKISVFVKLFDNMVIYAEKA